MEPLPDSLWRSVIARFFMNVARRDRVFSRAISGSMLLFTAALLRCSGNPTPERSDPCTTVYDGKCGAVCAADSECPAGLHCASGNCSAQCGGGVTLCASGQGCSDSGRCTTPESGSSSGGGPGLNIDASATGGSGVSGGTFGDDCPNIELELGEVTPTVVLLIDQSGSMETENLMPGVNRWQALKMALTTPGNVIETLANRVRFGFAFYSNHTGNQPPAAGVCPTIDTGGTVTPLMPPKLDNYTPFSTYFPPLPTFNNTPTGESIQVAAEQLAAFAEPGPKFIVLATDGEPDRCENADEDAPGGVSRDLVITNVQNAFQNQQISTFVISVGSDVALTHLNDVANAGQGFPIDDPTDRFFLVTTQDALTAAFETIIAGVRSCTLTLNGKIDPAQAASGSVTLDGVAIPLDPINGWTAGADGMTITLNGTACDTVKTNAQFVSATFPCEAVIEPPK
jgi:hypothetical protein